MTPTPLTPEQVIDRLSSYGYVFTRPARSELLLLLHRMVTRGGASMVVVEATAPDTTPISDVVRDGADKSSRETADSCRSMENGTPLTCELPAGHDGLHSFDPTPEGLVPDPREPGYWLGRGEDVPDGWEFRPGGSHEWATEQQDWWKSCFVQARPPQATTSPPRWTAHGNGVGLGEVKPGWSALIICHGDNHHALAEQVADALNAVDAAGAAAPQPQDQT